MSLLNGSKIQELERELAQLKREYNIVKEVLTLVVASHKTISFNIPKDIPVGHIHWHQAQVEDGSKQMTIWYEPGEEERGETDDSAD